MSHRHKHKIKPTHIYHKHPSATFSDASDPTRQPNRSPKNVLGRSRRLPQTHSRPCPTFQTFRHGLALLAPPNAIKANPRFAPFRTCPHHPPSPPIGVSNSPTTLQKIHVTPPNSCNASESKVGTLPPPPLRRLLLPPEAVGNFLLSIPHT